MQEMAILSCNRLDLNYRLQKGDRKALKIHYFLSHPHRLFTTILIFNDACLHIGSECSRRFFSALNWPSLIAPLSQVLLVIILAEMAPMFAARRYPESASRWGVTLLFPLSKLIGPLNWLIGKLSDLASFCFGIPHSDVERNLLSRDDLQALLIPLQDEEIKNDQSLADLAIGNLFAQRLQTAEGVMQPLINSPLVSGNANLERAKAIWLKSNSNHLLIYQHSRRQIIGILEPKQFARMGENATAQSCAHLPFFVSGKTPALEVLLQMRQNGGQIAVVLNEEGIAIGTLEASWFFTHFLLRGDKSETLATSRVLEKSFSAQITLRELMEQLKIELPLTNNEESLADFLEQQMGHLPSKGDICRFKGLEFCVESDSLTGAKTVNVRSLVY